MQQEQAGLRSDHREGLRTAAQAAATPITDMRGSVEQRKHLVGVLVAAPSTKPSSGRGVK